VPQFIGSIAGEGRSEPQWASYAGMAYTTGSVVGYVAFGFLADAFGRKPITMLYMLLALVLTPVLFLATQDLKLLLWLAFANAIFSNGQYSWMPVWLPELYPTRIRATAMAFAFNAPRFIVRGDNHLARLPGRTERSAVPTGDERKTTTGVKSELHCQTG
jgi:MFS family permease